MINVLHIGAATGELEFYHQLGVDRLVYAEPDRECLGQLYANINEYVRFNRQSIRVDVIPRACSSKTGESIKFYANGSGQSSAHEPQLRTKAWVGDNFISYDVETISLCDLAKVALNDNGIVDYLCLDTQGHEHTILCSVDAQYLGATFGIIDVELMADTEQYLVPSLNWKEVVFHLLKAGFEPIVHPHGITESYLFINPRLARISMKYVSAIASNVRNELMQVYFSQNNMRVSIDRLNSVCSIGDQMFLPLTHIAGSIHASQLQRFRERFLQVYFSILLVKS
jgi:FkbM family methyltransferase